MTYELAKQLKDAGFPKQIFLTNTEEEMAENQECYSSFPTLSELIEACGDGVGVFKINSTDANAWKKNWNPDEYSDTENGKTPEEAVAKLWLKINKFIGD